MNTDTKHHIDAARQVLVGVVPNPTSQIDQITNALIYKFMDDMDQSAIKQGGDPSFFVKDLKNYSWTRLMDARIGNQERMNIYSEALVKFSESKQLPPLFREIFKSSFLPYRSPEVLGLFLKEINYFDYSHSEELGNAYEYLLSVMGSQGDAGQFRTPRHIIDFVVEAVNPTVEDKVLDPACGTAGFLISAYKHILGQHDGKDSDGKRNNEKPLTPDQRKNLMSNFEGYDVDPGMVRISQVNMYLHQFKNPKIYNYNTLSMEERWGDKFSVILANPPFMSPKGGVSTHSKFSIQSSRSEVLFVDYIMNHLKPNGRAGIIVPEGIIFNPGTAHKQLRKNLVEDGLYAVVSLPSGVFQPYSGVKTSILFFGNELTKQKKEILFVDIKDTGVSLGTTQRPIEKNDLIPAIKIIKDFQKNKKIEENKLSFIVKKQEIIENDYDLSSVKYKKHIAVDLEKSFVALSDICSITKGKSSSTKTEIGPYPLILTAEESKTSDHFDFDGNGVCVPLISATGHGKAAIKRIHYVNGKFALANLLAFVEPSDNKKLNPKYLFHILNNVKDEMAKLMNGAANVSMKTSDLGNFQIPLPSIEIQNQIIANLDNYQNIMMNARQITNIWKPKIDIDINWEKVELKSVCDLESGSRQKGGAVDSGIYSIGGGQISEENSIRFNNMKYITEKHFSTMKKGVLHKDDVLMVKDGATTGKMGYWDFNYKAAVNEHVFIFRAKKNLIEPKFLYILLISKDFQDILKPFIKGIIGGVSLEITNLKISLPSIEIQKQIVERIESERTLIEGNKKLIEIYEQKTKEVLTKLWEE